MRGVLVLVAVIGLLATAARADLLDREWKAMPAQGVELHITRGEGRTGNDALRLDFDFHDHGGYAIAHRDGRIDLPENFELSFWMRAEAPRNTLEVKFLRGEDVWWSVRRELDFPKEWRRFAVKKRNIELAWGPGGKAPLPRTIDAIEIVVTAGTGGKGTVWIDDAQIAPLDTAPDGPLPKVTNVPWNGDGPFTFDLGRRHELGGLVIDWDTAPDGYDVATSFDGKEWSVVRNVKATNGGRDWISLPDGDARWIRIQTTNAAIRDVRLLPPMRSDNEFFTAIAKESPRGDYPRYLHEEQSYWTVLGGESGEEAEALLSEDGTIEAGNARFSVEPFLMIDGTLVTWNNVAIEQRPGPEVVWRKHLTITPHVANDVLSVRYVTPPNATLYLAIRPFQVNPSWQFLKRTGGTVKITHIAREGNTIRVDADQEATIVAAMNAFGATSFDAGDIVEYLHAGTLPAAQEVTDDVGYASAAMRFDSHDVTISIPLGPPSKAAPPPQTEWMVDVPAEPRIAETLAAQLHFILVNRDGPAIQPGSRSYERSWIRDGSLTSVALLRLGHAAEVRQFIEWYAKYVAPSGYVPCCVSKAGADPVVENDSHGEFVYLVAEDYRHTRDRVFAEAMWPIVKRVADFIDRARQRNERLKGTPYYGLLPESISHEGYSAKPVHSYWDDFWALKGLRDAAFLATELDKRSEMMRYTTVASAFRQDLRASIEATMKKHGIDYVPGSVELGDFDPTSTTIGVEPVDAFDGTVTPALRRTFDEYWEHALEPRTYTPYELRIVGTFVRFGEPARARQLLDYFFADQRPAAWRQWAEVVHRDPRQPAFVGDMPHTWVGSDFIRSALDLFVYEQGDALVLGAGISEEWTERGVRIAGISTHHGILGYSMKKEGDAIRVPIDAGLRSAPIFVISPFDGRRIPVPITPIEIVIQRGGQWSVVDSTAPRQPL